MTLRQLREQHSYSQREVAAKINVSLPTIGAWEAGKAKPLPVHVRALAKFYGVSIAEIQAAIEASAAQAKEA